VKIPDHRLLRSYRERPRDRCATKKIEEIATSQSTDSHSIPQARITRGRISDRQRSVSRYQGSFVTRCVFSVPCPVWVVISAGLTARPLLPIYSGQRTSSDRPGWSGSCHKRKSGPAPLGSYYLLTGRDVQTVRPLLDVGRKKYSSENAVSNPHICWLRVRVAGFDEGEVPFAGYLFPL